MYISFSTPVKIGNVTAEGGIKSIDPPCTGTASATGHHPFTCSPCHSQLKDLQSHIRKRKHRLHQPGLRIGKRGVRKSYATKRETYDALHTRPVKKLKNETEAKHSHQSSDQGDRKRLVDDLSALFKKDVDIQNPMQFTIINNLVGKLKSGRNHRFSGDMKNISKLYRNKLGRTNYNLCKQLFGLCSSTTCDNLSSGIKLQPGLNWEVFDEASCIYGGNLVIDCSDEARTTKSVQPFKGASGETYLIGEEWSPDCESWAKSGWKNIPRIHAEDTDDDEFTLLEHYVKDLIQNNKLSKSTFIHNFSALTSIDCPNIIHAMWPVPSHGMTAKCLLKIWAKIRYMCYYTKDNQKRSNPIRLMGHSTDAAGFSLSAAILLMTPNAAHLKNKVKFLNLGVPGERFVAPYYWNLCPTIAYLDWDHAQRCLLRCLKYPTRQLTMFKSRDGSKLATINHLKQLKSMLDKSSVKSNLHDDDLVILKFHDQQIDAAYRVFSLNVVDHLETYVPGSDATCLYISAIFHLINPFRTFNAGTPADVQTSVSLGIMILRLWKKYLEIRGLPLHSKPGTKNDTSKCGHFITYGSFMSAEILFAAATLHNLALYRHHQQTGLRWVSPRLSGTRTTERIICELQGKTSEIQSLDQQPTFADMLHRASAVQFNQNVTKDIGKQPGITVAASTSRKRTLYDFHEQTEAAACTDYPQTYLEFKKQQQSAHFKGIEKAHELIEKYVPEMKEVLVDSDAWDMPYTFANPEGTLFVDEEDLPETYNKLQVDMNSGNFEVDAGVEGLSMEDAEETEDAENGCTPNSANHTTEPHEGDTGLPEDDYLHENDQTDNSWYITRSVGKKTSKIHISKALKIIMGRREHVSRERSRRHFVSPNLPDFPAINKEHDLHVGKLYAVRVSNSFKVGKLLVLRSKEGTFVDSGKSTDSDCSLRFLFLKENGDHFVYSNLVSPYRSSSSVIKEVHTNDENATKVIVSQTSLDDVKHMLEAKTSAPVTENDNQLEDDEYEIDSIVDSRINSTLSREYKVRFKGYGSDDDTWLPSSAFNREVSFQSTSTRGRKRKHTIQKDNTIDPFFINYVSSAKSASSSSAPSKQKSETHQKSKTLHRKKTGKKAASQPITTNMSPITTMSNSSNMSPPVTTMSNSSKDLVRECKVVLSPLKLSEYQSSPFPLKPSRTGNGSLITTTSGSGSKILAQDVARWGGHSKNIRLRNTCPIDNILTSLSITYKNNDGFRKYIASTCAVTNMKIIRDILNECQSGQWVEAKIKWLTSFGNVPKSSLMDAHGSEAERGLDALLETPLAKVDGINTSTCSNTECPGGNIEDRMGRFHLNIHNE